MMDYGTIVSYEGSPLVMAVHIDYITEKARINDRTLIPNFRYFLKNGFIVPRQNNYCFRVTRDSFFPFYYKKVSDHQLIYLCLPVDRVDNQIYRLKNTGNKFLISAYYNPVIHEGEKKLSWDLSHITYDLSQLIK